MIRELLPTRGLLARAPHMASHVFPRIPPNIAPYIARLFCALAIFAPCLPSIAQPVGNTILLGQSGEFSGQGVARENMEGAQLYFTLVNKRGGVFGRQIELKTYDDAREVTRTVANTERLIAQDKVFALFGYRSTPAVEAVLPAISKEGIPMIAPFSGAQSIRLPLNPYVYHLRAGYREEAAGLIKQLSVQGIRRISVLYQQDSFGKDALAGFQDAMKEANITAVASATYDRKDMDVAAAAKSLGAGSPAAVVMACSPKACVDFIKKMRAAGSTGQFLTLSNVNSEEFALALGDEARGVIVSQVVPYPWSNMVPLAREFQAAIKETTSRVPLSYSSFEGFVAAKLTVQALKLAGKDLTRKKLIDALDSMHNVDLGGMTVSFSPTNHRGSNFVDLTLISRGGKYIR